MAQIKWILMAFALAAIFCASFVFFYAKRQNAALSPTAEVEKKQEQALPEAKLTAPDLTLLPDELLRKGKVVLIFVAPDCEACITEAQFLQTVKDKRNDVGFYGVVSFGDPKTTLEAAVKKFPFKVYYDGESLLALNLKITRVPVKIYIEDGIIKKVWGGATIDENKQKEFADWLESV